VGIVLGKAVKEGTMPNEETRQPPEELKAIPPEKLRERAMSGFTRVYSARFLSSGKVEFYTVDLDLGQLPEEADEEEDDGELSNKVS